MVDLACSHCGIAITLADDYMVHDELWHSVMPTRRGFLHPRCLEVKLGRRIALSDLTSVPANDRLFNA